MSVGRLALAMRGRNLKKGQGMTEYIIIVALIAVACVALVAVFGKYIKQMFNKAIKGITGSDIKSIDKQKAAEDADSAMKKTDVIDTSNLVGEGDQ